MKLAPVSHCLTPLIQSEVCPVGIAVARLLIALSVLLCFFSDSVGFLDLRCVRCDVSMLYRAVVLVSSLGGFPLVVSVV